MLRRLTVTLTILSLVLVSITPLTATALAVPSTAAQRHGHQRSERKLAPELDTAATSSETVRLIVQTKGRPSAAQDQAIEGKRGRRKQTLDTLDAMVVDLPASEVASLAAREDVLYVSPDRTVTPQMEVTREATGAALVQSGVGGPHGTPGFTGRGITIAVVDSGISAGHPDFQKRNRSRVLQAVNFTGTTSHGDRYGHGTGVAGVAAGNGAGSNGYAGNYSGIAPEADIVDLKVLDQNGVGTTSATLSAINWAISNQRRYGIRVINMSIGTPPRESFRTDPLSRAVARAVNAGIVVVCSAGNYGRTDEIVGHEANGDPIYRKVYGAINSPGNSPYAITVGATDTHATGRRSDDTVAQFSSKGPTQFDRLPKPDLVAPGRRLNAPMSQNNPTLGSEYPDRVVQPTGATAVQNAYFNYSGTSFSAPVVSGVIALMLEANNSLTPVLTKATLLRTANALPLSLFHSKTESLLSQGAGEVNAAAAVEMAQAIVHRADRLNAGDRIFRHNVTLRTLSESFEIGGEVVASSTRVLYSNGVIFANRPVLTNGITLGNGVVLGDGIMMTDGIIAGSGILLDDGIMMTDGYVLGDGSMFGDSLLLSGGIVFGNGIMMTDGFVLGDGIMMTDGVVLGDGIMMTDGVVLGDGIMMTDGVVIGDGIMMTDGVVLGDGIMMTDGIAISGGILHTNSIIVGDSIVLGNGVVMGDGYVFCDGVEVSSGAVLSSGTVVSSGVVLGDSVVVASGIMMTD